MGNIADFNDAELSVIQDILTERYGRKMQIQLADSELRLSPTDRELTACPTIFWQDQRVSFVIFKVASERYRCQFFYGINQQYGTGIEEYDNIGDCAVSLLRVQAYHALQKKVQQDT
jgi:hypothetical protein